MSPFIVNTVRLISFRGSRGGGVGRGTALQAARSWVRCPMMSLEFFIDIILPALGLTQPLTEMSTGMFPGVKGGRGVRLTTLPRSCANGLEIWEPQHLGTLRPCSGLYWDFFYFNIV
jgi:hypothetical protein